MKLLLCIDHFGPGGAQRQLVALAGGLQSLGHEIEFFIYHPHVDHFGAQVDALGMKVHAHRKAGRFAIGPVLSLASTMRRGHYDAVLAYLATPAMYAELAKAASPRLPLVISERFMYTSLNLRVRVQQEFHRLASWITVNSKHQRDRMEQRFPWMRSKISTIYNGVDLEAFSPSGTPSRRDPSEPLKLLVVSSTAAKKNALGLAKALAVVRRRGGTVPFVTWAGGPTSPEDEHAQLEVAEFLGAHSLGAHWAWLGKRQDVPELMRSHDALIHPAFFEGLPNAICEALASGLPVLASDVGDHRELVGADRGLLFAPGDAEDIADVVMGFASLDTPARALLGVRAREYAVASLSLDRYARDYERLFQLLLDTRPGLASIGTS